MTQDTRSSEEDILPGCEESGGRDSPARIAPSAIRISFMLPQRHSASPEATSRILRNWIIAWWAARPSNDVNHGTTRHFPTDTDSWTTNHCVLQKPLSRLGVHSWLRQRSVRFAVPRSSHAIRPPARRACT